MSKVDLDRTVARFTLTEPVELEDMRAIKGALNGAFPGVACEVFRHRAGESVTVRVDRTISHLPVRP